MLARGLNLIWPREVADPMTVRDRPVLRAMPGIRQATSVFAPPPADQHVVRVWIIKIVDTVILGADVSCSTRGSILARSERWRGRRSARVRACWDRLHQPSTLVYT